MQFSAREGELRIAVSSNGTDWRRVAAATPMTMRLYNTLSRTEEVFTPGPDETVRMYTCGLTVYARGHIGNFRTFICIDVLRRTLKYLLGKRYARC